MARLTLRLLGPLQVTLDGRPITGFESDKVRALLAYLAMERERPQRRERLAGLLWPERSERSARTNLRVALANLRTAIGDRQADPPFLCITRQTIQLNPEGDSWIDVSAFNALIESETFPALEQAIECYEGDFLEGFSLSGSAAFEEWVVLTRERLARHALRVLQKVARHCENQGAHERAMHYARRQVALDPWGERGHRRVLRLLAETDRRNAALAHYEALCQTLAQDLGVEPEDETVALYRRIRNGAAPDQPALELPHNLPAPLTPFVGRQEELAALAARLRDPTCRLLTLVGPGGSGKTRLALETARRLLGEVDVFPHGLYFVELAPLQSPADVVAAVAEVLAFPLSQGQPPEEQVIDYLRPKRLLHLVLGEVALARGDYGRAEAHLQESVAVSGEIDQWDEGCRALATLAYAARGLGRRPWLPVDLCGELCRAARRGAFFPLLWGLPVLALHLADEGQAARAVELYALAKTQPLVSHSKWFERVVGRSIAAAATLPTATLTAVQQRGRSQHLVQTVGEIVSELSS